MDGKLIGSWDDVMGTKVEMSGVFEGKKLSGTVTAGGYDITYTAGKVE